MAVDIFRHFITSVLADRCSNLLMRCATDCQMRSSEDLFVLFLSKSLKFGLCVFVNMKSSNS